MYFTEEKIQFGNSAQIDAVLLQRLAFSHLHPGSLELSGVSIRFTVIFFAELGWTASSRKSCGRCPRLVFYSYIIGCETL